MGITLGIAIWTVAASAGIVALLGASEPLFRKGLLSNLGNPKIAVFFASLLPQFVPSGDASFVGFLSLGFLFCALGFLWLSLYVVTVDKLRDLLVGRVQRALDAVSGVVLVGLGIRLASESR